MPLSNYSELQASVADWINRDDLTDQIPDFITLCEASMQRRLLTFNMEATTTLQTVANTATLAVPTGFNGVRSLQVYYDSVWHDVQNASLEPSLYNGVTPYRPVVYSIVGSNFEFRPIPNGVYDLSLDYWAKFAPLSDSNTTNWILTNNPDAYLFGTLLVAAPFLGTDDRVGRWALGFDNAIEQINSNDVAAQFDKTKLRVDPGLTSRSQVNIYTGRFW